MRYEVVNLIQSVEASVKKNKDGTEGITVKGTAIRAGNEPNINGYRYSVETLKKYASALIGFKMVMDHIDSVEKVVGTVTKAYVENDRLRYETDINTEHPSKIHTGVLRGDINSVSIKALSDNMVCSICEKQWRECNHVLLEEYDSELCVGDVKHLEWIHLSFVLHPADIYATDSSISTENALSDWNRQQASVLVQQMNSTKEKYLKNKGDNKLPDKDKVKISQDEAERVQETLIATLNKEKEAALQQRDEQISTLQKQLESVQIVAQNFENEKKEKLISQICEVSGEKPETYNDMSVSSLEKIKSSIMSFKSKYAEDEDTPNDVSQSEGAFHAKQPSQPAFDEAEEHVRFLGRLFNMKWVKKDELTQEDKLVVRIVSQREHIKFGEKSVVIKGEQNA